MTATRIELTTADGVAPAYVFGDAAAPGVLLFIDAIGMRPAMWALGERLAAEGFHVLMPDLFWRVGPYTAPEPKAFQQDPAARSAWFGKMMPAGAAPKVMADLPAYLAHFDDRPIGVTGYCLGGRLAIIAAETFPDRIAAAAAYHPGGLVTDAADSPHRAVSAIRARVYIAGAMDDATFTDEQRATFAAALAAAGVPHEVERYEAKHGWVPADSAVHDEAAAAKHWVTLLALLRQTLN